MANTSFKTIKCERIKNRLKNLILIMFLIGLILIIMFFTTEEDNPISNLTKIIPPIILTIALYLIQEWRYYKNVYLKYNGRVFEVHPKGKRVANPTIREIQTIKNKLIYQVDKNDNYEGEIILDLINLRYGKGTHNSGIYEDENQDNETEKIGTDDRFGFSQFVLTDDKIFVEHPYTVQGPKINSPGERVYKASVWKRKIVDNNK